MASKTNDYTEGRARKNTSPNTEQTDFGLRAMKTYDNAKSRVGHKENSWEATDSNAKVCNQEGTSACNR